MAEFSEKINIKEDIAKILKEYNHCYNKNNRPIWITRKYGPEGMYKWWSIYKLPEIYLKDLKLWLIKNRDN